MAQTAFTCQGLLKSGSAPFSGSADWRFTLYTAASGSSIVGAPITIASASVTDGLVTLTSWGPCP